MQIKQHLHDQITCYVDNMAMWNFIFSRNNFKNHQALEKEKIYKNIGSYKN